MRILYCDKCESRIEEGEIGLGGAVSRSDNRTYCSRCAPLFPEAPLKNTSRQFKLSTGGTPVKSPKAAGGTKQIRREASKPFPFLAVGGAIAAAVLLLVIYAWSKKSTPPPVSTPAVAPVATSDAPSNLTVEMVRKQEAPPPPKSMFEEMAQEHNRSYDSSRRAPPPNTVPEQPKRTFVGARELIESPTSWNQAVLLLGKLTANAGTGAETGSISINNNATLAPSAKGTVSGFGGNGANWAQNGGANLIANNAVTLTDNGNGEGRSVFLNAAVPDIASGFNAQFTYTASGNKRADGAAFIIQNDPRGTSALGSMGGGLGYGGIKSSFAIMVNIYPGATGGIGVAFGQNGTATTPYISVEPVNLNLGSDIHFSVTYDGTDMVVTLNEDQTTHSFTLSAPVKLAADLGKTSGFVGFSAATGGEPAIHTIKDFILAPSSSDSASVTREKNAVYWNQFTETGAAVPYTLPEEYDLRAVFERRTGTGPVYVLLSAGGHPFRWSLGMANNTYFGFADVGGKRIEGNPTALLSPRCLWNNARYTTVVQVRKNRITAYLNDKVVTEWTPELGALGVEPSWVPRGGTAIGVATSQRSEVVLYSLELLEKK